jgi:3',5'-cyclic AMP phosphodiesterase CpdA
MTFRLAHLTDLHVPPATAFRARSMMSRRFLGWISWTRRRHRIHRREVLDALAADVAALKPDHVAVTGDLVNLALPMEFEQGARFLGELGTPTDVTFVPGNHDAYVPPRWRGSWDHVGAFMRGDDSVDLPADRWATFPFVRRRGPLALIGVSTAVSNPPTLATGKIGREQLARLRHTLRELRGTCFRVVLLHHPPGSGMAGWRRRLVDAFAFRAVLRDAGAELVLSGHQHRFQFAQINGPDGPIPLLGGPSASLLSDAPDRYGGYLVHTISPEAPWTIDVEARRYDAGLGRCRPDFAVRVTAAANGGPLSLVPKAPTGEATPVPV